MRRVGPNDFWKNPCSDKIIDLTCKSLVTDAREPIIGANTLAVLVASLGETHIELFVALRTVERMRTHTLQVRFQVDPTERHVFPLHSGTRLVGFRPMDGAAFQVYAGFATAHVLVPKVVREEVEKPARGVSREPCRVQVEALFQVICAEVPLTHFDSHSNFKHR